MASLAKADASKDAAPKRDEGPHALAPRAFQDATKYTIEQLRTAIYSDGRKAAVLAEKAAQRL